MIFILACAFWLVVTEALKTATEQNLYLLFCLKNLRFNDSWPNYEHETIYTSLSCCDILITEYDFYFQLFSEVFSFFFMTGTHEVSTRLSIFTTKCEIFDKDVASKRLWGKTVEMLIFINLSKFNVNIV